jgi:putative transposase
MKKRKSNRLKGYDYSKNNLYFITNCVKYNLCCLGNVISAGTGRDLSVHYPEIHHSESNNPESHYPEINHSEIHNPESNNSESNNPESHYPEINHSEINYSKIHNPNLDYIMELNQYGLIVEERIKWLMSQYKYVAIHNYVVMPNHFHLILEIDSEKVKGQDIKIKSLSSLMGAMKTTSSNLIHDASFEDFAWHRSFHDHIIRDEKSYQNISNYIDLNPQKWFQDRFYNKD